MKSKVMICVLSLFVVIGVFPAQYTELNIVEIKRPFDEEEVVAEFQPACVVNNNSTYTETAKVTCKIKDLETYDVVYEDVLSSFPCHPGNSSAKFREFEPEGSKDYNALFTVESAFSGDARDKNFYTTPAYNVTAVEILSPIESPYHVFAPSAAYEEIAGLATQAALICELNQIQVEPVVVYYDHFEAVFAPHEAYDATFAEVAELDMKYAYYLYFWAEDTLGNFISEDTLMLFIGTHVEENKPTDCISLAQPTLIDNSTEIYFYLPQRIDVSLKAYDAAGVLIETLKDGVLSEGSHRISWDVADIEAGVYFVRFSTPGFSVTRKVVIVD